MQFFILTAVRIGKLFSLSRLLDQHIKECDERIDIERGDIFHAA
jgi:hypothetical protein